MPADPKDSAISWGFLTNHAYTLLCIANDPNVRLRDIASQVGITERATQSIVADLVRAGYVDRTRVGRRNRYRVHREKVLAHLPGTDRTVGDLLSALTSSR